MRQALRLSAALLSATVLPLSGQLAGRIDLGFGGASLPRGGEASLWSLAPELRWTTARSRVQLAGEYRDFGFSRRGATGLVAGSWYAPLAHPLTLEVLAEGRAQSGTGLATRGAGDAGMRLHLIGARQGAWIGSRLGSDAAGGTFHWEAAAWRRLGPFSVQLQGRQSTQSIEVSTRRVLDTLTPRPDTLGGGSRNQTMVLTDLGSWLGWSGRRLQVLAAGGIRFGLYQPAVSPTSPGTPDLGQDVRYTSVSEGWWMGEVTYWMTDRLAIAGSVGRHLGDPSLLAPAGRFLRLNLRATLGRQSTPPEAVRVAAARGLRFTRVEAGLVEFSLGAPAAARVELIGDFTDWVPVDLNRGAEGRWWVRLPAEPGLHRVNVRYDGGAWVAPPGTRTVTDEFELSTGVVIIE